MSSIALVCASDNNIFCVCGSANGLFYLFEIIHVTVLNSFHTHQKKNIMYLLIYLEVVFALFIFKLCICANVSANRFLSFLSFFFVLHTHTVNIYLSLTTIVNVISNTHLKKYYVCCAK